MLLAEIATLLDSAGVGTFPADGSTYPVGTDVAIAVLGAPAAPQQCVTLTSYPGVADDDRNGWRYPRMQVRVRGTPDARVAIDLDEAAYQALQAIGPQNLGDGFRLVDCHALQSSPQPIGQDGNGCWELTRNYQLSIEPL